MVKNKLFELLSTFTPREFESFGVFLDSPYMNSSTVVKNFYKHFSGFYPEFNSCELGKEKVFAKLYAGENFNDKKIRDLSSRSLELAEDFLGYLRLKDDAALLKRSSLEEIARRGLTKHFAQKARELEGMLSKTKVRDSKYLYNIFSLAKHTREFYSARLNLTAREELITGESVERDYFIFYFASVMLEYFVNGQADSKLINLDTKFEMIEEILQYLEQKDIGKYPQIQVMYYGMLLERKSDNPELYHKLKSLLFERTDEVDPKVLRRCMIILYNFTKEKALKQDPFFVNETFQLLKLITDRGLYPVENGFMNESAYLTTVGEGLIHKDFDWTKKFIEDFKERIRPEQRENAYLFANATFDYRMGKYDSALEKLAMVKTNDQFFTIRVKNNQIKIYVETENYDLAENAIHTFKKFLMHDEFIVDFVRNRFLNYMNFASKMLSAIQDDDHDKLAVLKSQISNAKDLENRSWLLNRIDIALAKH